jgi:hypothetical protein
MKASLIKKIINKKVTFSAVNSHIPLKNRHSPISYNSTFLVELFLTQKQNLNYGTQR